MSTEPWFGAWPPELKGQEDMNTIRRATSRLNLSLAMIAVFFSGVILVLGARLWVTEHTKPALFIDAIGTAFLVAAILGTVIDNALKRELVKEAVGAALGYLLPESLKKELRWVYDLGLVCTRHTSVVTIKDIGNGKVLMNMHQTRTICNPTPKDMPFKPRFTIEDWGDEAHPSTLIELSWKREGHDNSHLEFIGEQVNLAPKEECTVVYRWEEIKPVNGRHDETFYTATNNPLIIINADEAFDYYASFGHRDGGPNEDGKRKSRKSENTFELDGTLLPYQHFVIRWWKKKPGEGK